MRKLEYNFVSDFFKKNNCILLEAKYENARVPLKYQCQCGIEAAIRFDDFRKGMRCMSCGIKKTSTMRRTRFDDVKKYFEKYNYQLVSKQYINNQSPLISICPLGHDYQVTFHNFKSAGRRCKKCSYENRRGTGNPCWISDRLEVERNLLFKKKCHGLLARTLKKIGKIKIENTKSILGYSPTDLKNHIQSHPNWKLVCEEQQWHLDHIFPIKAFLDLGIFNLKIINSLDNLQPLKAKDNMSKSDSYDKQEFLNWLKTKGQLICDT